jgi:hypothetical protein
MLFGIVSKTKQYITHYKRINRLFDGFNSDSFYAEDGKAKSFISKVLDYLYIFFRLKIMPENYHLFGFDRKKRSEFKQYLGEPWDELFIRRKIGKLWRNGIVLRDKQMFKIICDYYQMPIPRHYGLLRSGKLDGGKENTVALIERYKPEKLVIKPVLGQNGVGIQSFSPSRLEEICADKSLHQEDYLIEEAIEQHPELNRINPHSVNSVRLITFLCLDGRVEILSGMLKTSATKVPIDNFSLGGIAIGINLETGILKGEGYVKFYSPDAVIDNRQSTDQNTIDQILEEIKDMQVRFPGRILKHHPLTQCKFEGFQLPYWKQIIETAVKAQQVFCHGKANAVDIAITPEGPVLLEGNEGWGTTGIQAANGGILTERNQTLFSQYGIKFY